VCYLVQAARCNQDEARGASILGSRAQRVAKLVAKYILNGEIYFLYTTNFKLLRKIKGN
jgi:hypothetical protein